MSTEYLVTGGAGFIGSNTVRTLVARGLSVRVIDDISTGRRENLDGLEDKIDFMQADIRDAAAVAKAVEGIRYVIHMAAVPSVPKSVDDPLTTSEVNIEGTLKLLIAARDAGVERFVQSSSSSVYGDTPTLPKQEDMKPSPMSPYALSKLTNEHQCRLFYELYGLKTFSLRYFNVFGPRQNPKSQYAAVVPLFIEAFQADKSPVIFGDGEQTRDFTYVEDVIAANLACLNASDEAIGGVYNVGCGDRMTVNQLAADIAVVMGKEIKPVYESARAGDVRDSQADISRAKKHLGWEPQTEVQDGLRTTVKWFTS